MAITRIFRVEIRSELRGEFEPLFKTLSLSSVVDDGELGVTHVIRGEDHVANTAVQVQLFAALDFDVPEFAHLPLLMGDDGKPLSKRLESLSLQALRGFALAAAAGIAAAPAAAFYEAPELVWLIPLAGLMSVFDGFASTRLILANRRLQLGRVVAIEVGSQLLAGLTAILIALWVPSVVALLSAGLVRSLLRTIASHTLLEGMADAFAWERDARRELIRFGRCWKKRWGSLEKIRLMTKILISL